MFRNVPPRSSAPETDVAATARARQDQTAQIVDVREHGEWAAGHIPDAVHIPLGELLSRQQELNPLRPVITVWRSGNRSLVAAEFLLAQGFQDVKSLAGGMKAWSASGQPVERW